jgi:hypothetical protein
MCSTVEAIVGLGNLKLVPKMKNLKKSTYNDSDNKFQNTA